MAQILYHENASFKEENGLVTRPDGSLIEDPGTIAMVESWGYRTSNIAPSIEKPENPIEIIEKPKNLAKRKYRRKHGRTN